MPIGWSLVGKRSSDKRQQKGMNRQRTQHVLSTDYVVDANRQEEKAGENTQLKQAGEKQAGKNVQLQLKQ